MNTKIIIKRCHWCGVRPHLAKLWPFEDRWACSTHFKEALQWHEQRSHVVSGLESLHIFHKDVARGPRPAEPAPRQNWRGYIEECVGLATFALTHDDRRTFVYYFSRALWAWSLSVDSHSSLTEGEHMIDETEGVRKTMVQEINSEASERAAIEAKYGQVWDTEELKRDFAVRGFMAPFVVVTRKSDGKRGSLMFQHQPRYYFCWMED